MLAAPVHYKSCRYFKNNLNDPQSLFSKPEKLRTLSDHLLANSATTARCPAFIQISDQLRCHNACWICKSTDSDWISGCASRVVHSMKCLLSSIIISTNLSWF